MTGSRWLPYYDDPPQMWDDDDEKEWVKFVVEWVAKSVVRNSKSSGGGRRGLDLSTHEKALILLLRAAQEEHAAALEEWLMRRDPSKPKKRLEDNLDPADVGPIYDYGDDAGAGLEDWDKHHKRFYRLNRGHPHKEQQARPRGLPVEPLERVWGLVGHWWIHVLGKKRFNPSYPIDPERGELRKIKIVNDETGEEKEDEIQVDPRTGGRLQRNAALDILWYNPAGRLFLLVAQAINPHYTASNCNGLKETIKKRRRRRNKKRRLSK